MKRPVYIYMYIYTYTILIITVTNINVMTGSYHGTERPAPARSLKFVSVYLFIYPHQ
jgi:hypothetical protein